MNGLGSGSLPLRRTRLTRNTKSAPPGGFRSLLQSSLSRCAAKSRRREFKLVAEGDFGRHPEDARDFSIQPPSGKAVDEFVLKFQKPM